MENEKWVLTENNKGVQLVLYYTRIIGGFGANGALVEKATTDRFTYYVDDKKMGANGKTTLEMHANAIIAFTEWVKQNGGNK